MREFYEMSALELRERIRRREIGVEELVRAYLKRIETYDQSRRLNTIAALHPSVIKDAQAMDNRQADRDLPLFGLPLLIKDNIDVGGMATTAGSLALTDNVITADAVVVRNLRRNGALILGKTNLTEFANYTAENMPNGYSSRGGQVVNAYDPAKDPGGSSTGSAVAMSAGFCSAAVGTDTSFSIVGCAAKNGVTGFKPAFGSLSGEGIVPICHTMDTAGPITRTVSDAILMYSCMKDPRVGSRILADFGFPAADSMLCGIDVTDLADLKLAVNRFQEDKVPQYQKPYFDGLFGDLQASGVVLKSVEHKAYPESADIMCYEFRHDLEQYLSKSGSRFKTLQAIVDFYEDDLAVRGKYGIAVLKEALEKASGRMDDPVYLEAMALRQRIRAQLIEELKDYDACIMTGRTDVMHFAGLPSIALTIGMADEHSPVGMIMYGADEKRLLKAALAMETMCGPARLPVL